MGSVTGLIGRIVVRVQVVSFSGQVRCVREIPAPDVIHVSVSVVIYAGLTCCLGQVYPDVGGQVFVGGIHAGVQDRNDNVFLFGAQVFPEIQPTDQG